MSPQPACGIFMDASRRPQGTRARRLCGGRGPPARGLRRRRWRWPGRAERGQRGHRRLRLEEGVGQEHQDPADAAPLPAELPAAPAGVHGADRHPGAGRPSSPRPWRARPTGSATTSRSSASGERVLRSCGSSVVAPTATPGTRSRRTSRACRSPATGRCSRSSTTSRSPRSPSWITAPRCSRSTSR